ncbi:MAG: CdaR family protein [Oscillospiraceae bacterium]|nr:CdaR family protein [Oscillospiraceae bacterium]
MQKKLMNNLLLKIVSIVIALAVWLLIVNINDPLVVKSYSVPVTIQNGAYIESGGKTYRVEEEQQMVTVILKGNSSVVQGRGGDIEAVADLRQIVDMDTTPVMVPVTAACDGVASENITVIPRTMAIKIEDMESRDFTITVNTTDTPGKGYEVGSAEAKPEKVTVSGPASLIRKIDRVVAEVSTLNLSEDTTKTCKLEVYDKNQDEMLSSQTSYLKFDIGEPVVDVHIDLWSVRDNVSLNVNYVGEPAEGYQVGSVTVTPSTISVAGTDEALGKLSQNRYAINLPEGAVVLEGQDKDFETKLNLSDYMPDDIIVANNVKSAIVNVSIIPIGSKQLTLQTKNINVQNLDNNLRVVFDTDKLVIGVKASDSMLEALTESSVAMTIDMTGMKTGDYEVPVQVELPLGCELLNSVKTLVRVSQLE